MNGAIYFMDARGKLMRYPPLSISAAVKISCILARTSRLNAGDAAFVNCGSTHCQTSSSITGLPDMSAIKKPRWHTEWTATVFMMARIVSSFIRIFSGCLALMLAESLAKNNVMRGADNE